MSLQHFKKINELHEKTIANSKAELSNSEKYAIWVEKISPDKDEVHILHLDEKPHSVEAKSQIRSVASNFQSITCDGRAILRIGSIGHSPGEDRPGKKAKKRLLKRL